MLESLATIFSVLAPVLAVAGLGYLWGRSGRPYDRGMMTAVIGSLGTPCLVFSKLVALQGRERELIEMSSAALLAFAIFVVVGVIALRLLRLPMHTFLAPLTFGNAGNLGLPVSQFAFPESGDALPGLALATCYFAVSCMLQFTVGISLWTGLFSPRQLARTPMVWSVVAAVAVLALDVPVPRWLLDTTELLGSVSVPLMLVTLGVSLAELGVVRLPLSLGLSVLKIGSGVATGYAVAHLLGLEGPMRGVLILQCSMPVAVFNYLFAEQYQRSPGLIASMVVVSTLLSFVTLPLLLAVLL